MKSLTTSLWQFTARHRDLPAFHAGVFAITIVLAALFNLGSFGLLLLVTLALDLSWILTHTRERGPCAVLFALRSNIETITLFFAAAVISMTMLHSVKSALSAPSIQILTDVTIVSAVAAVAAKWKICSDLIYTLMSYGSRTSMPRFSRAWTAAEILCLSILLLSLVVLVLAPTKLGIGMDAFMQALGAQLVPHLP